MKRIYLIFLIMCISLILIIFYRESNRVRYIHFDSRGFETDATKFVVSGEYYFNCKSRMLVRKIPLYLSIKEVLSLPIEFDYGIKIEHVPVIQLFLADPGWVEGFYYLYTEILEEYPVIHSHIFEREINVEGKKYIITLFYGVGMEGITIFIDEYDPERYRGYEQLCEQAKNSCSEPQ